MAFEIQVNIMRSLYNWVNDRNSEGSKDESFSPCTLNKTAKYFAASCGHLVLLFSTPIAVAIDIIISLAYLLSTCLCGDKDCINMALVTLLEAGANILIVPYHILGILIPVAADRLSIPLGKLYDRFYENSNNPSKDTL